MLAVWTCLIWVDIRNLSFGTAELSEWASDLAHVVCKVIVSINNNAIN